MWLCPCHSWCDQLCSSCAEQASLHSQQELKIKATSELELVVPVRLTKVGSTNAAPSRISVSIPGPSPLTKSNPYSSELAQESNSSLPLLALPWVIPLAIGLKPLAAGLTPLPSHKPQSTGKDQLREEKGKTRNVTGPLPIVATVFCVWSRNIGMDMRTLWWPTMNLEKHTLCFFSYKHLKTIKSWKTILNLAQNRNK